MKVHSAIVKLVLRKNKTLADGTHPIMLRVSYGGSAEKSTHISCRERDWDARNMLVRKSVQNWSTINEKLKAILRDALDKRDALEAKEKPYTAAMVLDSREPANESDTFQSLMESYIRDNAIGITTIKSMTTVGRELDKFFGRSTSIYDLSTETVGGFIRSKLKAGCKEGYIRKLVATIMSVRSYAIRRGFVVADIDSRLKKRLKESNAISYVGKRSIDFMKDYLLEAVLKKGTDELLDPKSDLFALYCWLFIYLFQGLAPIDCALLKVSDIKEISVKGVGYWAVDTSRRKTNKSVKIRIRKEGAYNLVMVDTLLKARSGYLLPILDGVDSTDLLKVKNAVSKKYTNMRRRLKKVLSEVNDKIALHNLGTNDNIPLIDIDKVTYYSARHSYAMAYIQSPNASPIHLSTLMGRSVNGLGTYIHQLTEESDITAASDVLI